jgi:eukaryotic-like serine/threonine-protein kinase
LHKNPVAPVRLNTSIPLEFEQLVNKAMEKDRDLRYQGAAEMRADLKRLKRDTSSGRTTASSGSGFSRGAASAGPSGVSTAAAGSSGAVAGAVPGSSASQVAATGSSVAVATGAVVGAPGGAALKGRRYIFAAIGGLVLVALAFGAYKLLNRPHALNLQNMQFTQITDSGKVGAVAISGDGRYIVYVMVDGEKESLWVRNVATKSDVQVLAPDTLEIAGLTFSPDGNYVDFVRADKSTSLFSYLYTMPVLGGTPRQLIRDIDSTPSFSPDGKKFAYMRGVPDKTQIEVHIADADGSGDRLLKTLDAEPTRFAMNGVSWSPDGKMILAPVLTSTKPVHWAVSAINVSDGAMKEIVSNSHGLGLPAWLPDGNAFVLPMAVPNEDRGQLWAVAYPSGELTRMTNDLSDYLSRISITRDGQYLVALGRRRDFHIWAAPAGQGAQARELTSGEYPDFDAVPGPTGKVLFRSHGDDIFSMNADGSQRALLIPDARNIVSISACGDRYIVFDRLQGKQLELWRADADGSNAIKLADDTLGSECSPDGSWVLFDMGQSKYARVPIEGGAASDVPFAQSNIGLGRISPDGKWIAFTYAEGSPVPVDKLSIVPATGGAAVKTMLWPRGGQNMHWSPDGKGIEFSQTRDGAGNVWEMALDGGAPRQITNFTSERIADFHWTRDGKTLLMSRGHAERNVILVSGFR